MIIDFHTHTFPDAIANKTISKLAYDGNIMNYSDGTDNGLNNSMKNAKIDSSLILPIATKPTQTMKINLRAAKLNESYENLRMISFGSIHPDNTNYKEIIKDIHNAGIRGIKLHPYYQNILPNDIKILRIVDTIESYNMITIFHAGFDVGFKNKDMASVHHFKDLYNELKPQNLVLAHMGGFKQWDDVEKYLVGLPVYFDTSFSLGHIEPLEKTDEQDANLKRIANEQFIRIVRNHGANRILFGSDSPWSNQKTALDLLQKSGITQEEFNLIKGANAKRLLKL